MNDAATARIEERLRALREQTGLPHTWRWISDRTGIDFYRVCRLKRGETRYQHSEQAVIAALLGRPAAELFADVPVVADGESGRAAGRKPRVLGGAA